MLKLPQGQWRPRAWPDPVCLRGPCSTAPGIHETYQPPCHPSLATDSRRPRAAWSALPSWQSSDGSFRSALVRVGRHDSCGLSVF